MLVAAACGEGDASDGDDGVLDGSITVFGASSLTGAFEEIGQAFEDAHPDVSVELSFAASSALREQILEGAPADVFASADTDSVDQVIDAGEAADPVVFAENSLEIVVPAGNPAGITGLEDFAEEDLLIGLCAEEVPCGSFGREALAKARVTPSIDTNEPDVKALLTKVEAGELDAGLVYVTDVIAAGDAVEGIEVPAADNVTATYPITTIESSSNGDVSEAFVHFVTSAEGREILASYGFESP